MADEKKNVLGKLGEYFQTGGVAALLVKQVADFLTGAFDAHKSARGALDGFRSVRAQFTGETDDEIIFHYAKDLVIEELGDKGRGMVEIVNHWLLTCLTARQRGKFTKLLGGSFVDQLVLFSEYHWSKAPTAVPAAQTQTKAGQQAQQSTQATVKVVQQIIARYSEELLRDLMQRAVAIFGEYAGYATDEQRTQALLAAHIISKDKVQQQRDLLQSSEEFRQESEDAVTRARQAYEASKTNRRR